MFHFGFDLANQSSNDETPDFFFVVCVLCFFAEEFVPALCASCLRSKGGERNLVRRYARDFLDQKVGVIDWLRPVWNVKRKVLQKVEKKKGRGDAARTVNNRRL